MTKFKGTKGLTHDRLTQVLNYDKDTGVFTWKVSLGRRFKSIRDKNTRRGLGENVVGRSVSKQFKFNINN